MAWRPLITVHNFAIYWSPRQTVCNVQKTAPKTAKDISAHLLSLGRNPSIVPNGSDLHSTTLERQMNPQHYQDEVCEPQPGPS